jgi:hypothetical protein
LIGEVKGLLPTLVTFMDNRERKGMDKVCGDQLFFCSWSKFIPACCLVRHLPLMVLKHMQNNRRLQLLGSNSSGRKC